MVARPIGVLVTGGERGSGESWSWLKRWGFAPVYLSSRDHLLAELEGSDVVVVDLDEGRGDDLELCRDIRSCSEIPVVAVGNDVAVDARIGMFRAGADDYVARPYEPPEFAARLVAVSRRYVYRRVRSHVLRVGDLEIDLVRLVVTVGGRIVRLTKTEFLVLVLIAEAGRGVCPGSRLAEEVWGRPYPEVADSLHVYICRLRAKLGRGGVIETVRVSGYRIADGADDREAPGGASAPRCGGSARAPVSTHPARLLRGVAAL